MPSVFLKGICLEWRPGKAEGDPGALFWLLITSHGMIWQGLFRRGGKEETMWPVFLSLECNFPFALYNIWYRVIEMTFSRYFSEKKCKKSLQKFVLLKKLHIFAPAFKEKHVPWKSDLTRLAPWGCPEKGKKSWKKLCKKFGGEKWVQYLCRPLPSKKRMGKSSLNYWWSSSTQAGEISPKT